ncbi:MAG: flagellar biosynthesis repressor FlbT [Rhizobiaceae bacterium]|nr:flagellar biosynthesis repressor FlbT [Rhizobiaceae bacterium]MCV0407001.1 flagellar biosynthesis repressor FlbT [Rhizobiaceae bacterium]
MKNTLRISLRPNEKIYINGAVLRVDRKVSIELMNDVHFLLEQHVLQAYEATTPLRQLYFIAQIMLMNPAGADDARDLFRKTLASLLETFENADMLASLKQVDQLVSEGEVFGALKTIRGLFRAEEAILNPHRAHDEPRLALCAGGA